MAREIKEMGNDKKKIHPEDQPTFLEAKPLSDTPIDPELSHSGRNSKS